MPRTAAFRECQTSNRSRIWYAYRMSMSQRPPNRCYYKPPRKQPRYWTAKKVAQVWCQAKADTGATEEEVIAEARKLCGWAESECERERELLRDIMIGLAELAIGLAIPQSAVARVLLAVSRVLPESWLIRMGITKLLTQLPEYERALRVYAQRIGKILADVPGVKVPP